MNNEELQNIIFEKVQDKIAIFKFKKEANRMKQATKRIVNIAATIIITIGLSIGTIYSGTTIYKKMDRRITNNEDVKESMVDDIVMNLEGTSDFLIDISSPKVRNENSEFIIIGTVESIEGGTNYNPTQKLYTLIQTIGTIKVDKVLKGEIKGKTLPFIRDGGTIPFVEYEKGLTESQKNKEELVRTLTAEEKRTKKVSAKKRGDIDIETGKTYLMYMTYCEDYDRYGILFFEYGMREIDLSTMVKSESKVLTVEERTAIQVKNNETGKYEKLNDVIGL